MEATPVAIRYSTRNQRIQFLFGTIWLLYGGISLYFSEAWRWTYFLFCILALFYIGAGLWYRYQPYVRIYADRIEEVRLRPRRLPFNRITEARTFAGDLILKSPGTSMRLNLKLVNESDRDLLLQTLGEYLPQSQLAD